MSCCTKPRATTTSPTRTSGAKPPATPVKTTLPTWKRSSKMLAVVAAAAGGLREAVAHGVTGQLMDSRRPEDWALALTRLLMVPGLALFYGGMVRRKKCCAWWKVSRSSMWTSSTSLVKPKVRARAMSLE